MKFAHEYKEALLKEGFPAHWVNSAVPYGQLKKVIKKVKKELEAILEEIGLEPADLVSTKDDGDGSIAFQYNFDGDEVFRPKLTLTFDGGMAIQDATLSPDTRKYLKTLVANRKKGDDTAPDKSRQEFTLSGDSVQRRGSTVSVNGSKPANDLRRVEIPLSFDAKFFELLQGDLTTLDALQAGEQKAMVEQITELSKEMTRLTTPSKFSKTDMYRWRALFDIYLQACVFFSMREQDRGSRSSAVAARQLDWFQAEVIRQGIVQSFKLPASHQALDRFITINITLLQNLKFQEINQKAIGKILKKFDKRTQLGATATFPKLIQSENSIMTETMAKAVCAQVTEDIVKITPQLDDEDYTCPICSTIAWRPIRLECRHVLCTKCTVELQRTFKYNCPICRRKKVVKEATEENIDDELIKKLKKYFPKETREKRIELETADGIARFGVTYKHPSEDKCRVM